MNIHWNLCPLSCKCPVCKCPELFCGLDCVPRTTAASTQEWENGCNLNFGQSLYNMHTEEEVSTCHFKHTTNSSCPCSEQKQRKFSHDGEQCDPVAWKCTMRTNRHTLAHARRNTAFHIIYGVFLRTKQRLSTKVINHSVWDFIAFNQQARQGPHFPVNFFFLLPQIMHHKCSYAVSTRGKTNNKNKIIIK